LVVDLLWLIIGSLILESDIALFDCVSIIIKKSSSAWLAMVSVGCISDGGLLRVEALVLGWWVLQFIVVMGFVVVSIIIICIIMGKSPLMMSAASAVNCGRDQS